ncbi:lysyl oxidase family protein [Miltoncostaea oceani]|uniref:lysyl oxidase family protein n=1 Tax=Miltoncostaea oceani TaxID=2843216 RepID=UPI001C3D696F|nr:lysyl oxidase family protein [Miltoncostaea oceani]
MQTDTHENPNRTETPRPSRRPRRAVLATLGVAAAAAAGLTVLATTVTSAPNLPDMISEAPGAPGTQIYRDGRLLVRFDGFVTNSPSAPAPLEIRALNPNGAGIMQSVQQRVGGAAVPPPAGVPPTVRFEVADGHNHYHLKNAAEYTLWTADQTRQVALAQKTEAGFCLEDSEALPGAPGGPVYSSGSNDFCRDVPLVMGISAGYRDIYYAGLSYQWIDVSDAAPGRYRLASRVDPTNVIAEADESNNGYAFRDAVVPGYMPRAVSVPRVDPGQTAPVTLSAERFVSTCFDGDFNPDPGDSPYCSPGSVRYRITSGTSRGVLKQGGATLSVGSVLTNGAITYTPNAGQRGADSFTYEAYDSTQTTFPRTRPQAAVAIQVGAPITSVAISGAQASIVAGLSMQLSAVLTNGPSGVTWTTTAGTITPAGLFTAPATAGTAVVRATSKDDPSVFAEVSIRVDAARVQGPAPTTPSILRKFAVGRVGKKVIVTKVTAGPRKGTLRTTATFGKKVVGRCAKPVKAGKTVTCKITLKRVYNLKKVKVTAKFTAAGKTTVRRAFVIPAKRR